MKVFDFTPPTQYAGKFELSKARTYRALFVQSKKRCTKIICTYVITNTKTGYVYVGSTHDFYGRWVKHHNLLKACGHTNIRLQEQWDTHQPCDFTIEIIRTFSSTDGLLDEEAAAARRFDPAMLLNYMIGMKMVTGWFPGVNAGQGRATRPPRTKRGKQQRARWFDGAGTVEA